MVSAACQKIGMSYLEICLLLLLLLLFCSTLLYSTLLYSELSRHQQFSTDPSTQAIITKKRHRQRKKTANVVLKLSSSNPTALFPPSPTHLPSFPKTLQSSPVLLPPNNPQRRLPLRHLRQILTPFLRDQHIILNPHAAQRNILLRLRQIDDFLQTRVRADEVFECDG